MSVKKYIISALLAAVMLISVGAVYFNIARIPSSDNTSPSNSTPLPSLSVVADYSDGTLLPSPSAATEYKEYRNSTYGYRFIYPTDLEVASHSKEEELVINFPGEGYWFIDVRVERATVSSPQEWLEQNKERYVLEQQRMIGSYQAVIVHMSDVDANPKEKTAILIKEGKLFQIFTRYVEHEKIWNSFSFQ